MAYKFQFIRANYAERFLRQLLPESRFGPGSAPKVMGRVATLAVDDRTNTVFVVGLPDRITQARRLLIELDVQQQGQPPILLGAPVLKTYTVAHAEAVAKLLGEVYRDVPLVRVQALGPNQIAVYARPEEQIQIAGFIPQSSELGVDVIPLTSFEADRAVDTLRAMFGGPGGPYLEADPQRNTVIVKGTKEQISEIKMALRTFGESSGKAGGMRILTLEKGSAATMAEALRHILVHTRANPVKVILPVSLISGPAGSDSPGKVDSDKKDSRPGKADQPITLTGFGNRLIVATEDPQALAAVVDLFRLLQAPAGEGEFEVVRLKHARAEDVARILEEVFLGPRPPQGGLPGGMKGAGPRLERVRVIADPATNSLLVKASPLDLFTIRNLLTRALDVPEAARPTDEAPSGKKGTGKKNKS
jgi:type II secretory pathway component GspD/PulD (secretin)